MADWPERVNIGGDGRTDRRSTRSDCVFCRIVAGDLPAHRVLDDDVAVAFLDARPVFKGHVLLVPAPTSRR